MPTLETFLLFAIADLALKISPGPDMALTLSRGMTQGFRAAWVSVLGTISAGFVQIPIVVLGLAALFAQSQLLFSIAKTAGALYLVYLGVRALLRSRQGQFPDAQPSAAHDRDIFLQGFITNLFNPKVLLFMVAFLPQFTDPARGAVWIQLTVLATYQKASGLLLGALFGYAASRIRRWVLKNPWFVSAQEGVLGVLMIGIGGWIIFSRNPVQSR
jgi:threonine/homoserine/homoserine lactone efflux protein